MDLLDKLLDASDQNSGMSLSAHDVKELLMRLEEDATDIENLVLTLDHVVDVFAPGKRSTVRN